MLCEYSMQTCKYILGSIYDSFQEIMYLDAGGGGTQKLNKK